MKKFKEAEIKSMLDMVTKDMISFSRFCELINERIAEPLTEFKGNNPFSGIESLSEHTARLKKERELGRKQ